jgi:branched-chain amino acid transport system ATP-binding protein
MTLMTIHNLEKRFGGLRAVDGASMEVREGELLGLIGPNGSGKTTLLNMLSGHLKADGGAIQLDGQNILGLGPTRLTRLGILRMFQMTRVFNRISAFDNLVVCGLALGLKESQAYARATNLRSLMSCTWMRASFPGARESCSSSAHVSWFLPASPCLMSHLPQSTLS